MVIRWRKIDNSGYYSLFKWNTIGSSTKKSIYCKYKGNPNLAPVLKISMYELKYHELLNEFFFPKFKANQELFNMFWKVSNDLEETKIIKPPLPQIYQKHDGELNYETMLKDCKRFAKRSDPLDCHSYKMYKYVGSRQLASWFSFSSLCRSKSM